jgi:hypothetical protein
MSDIDDLEEIAAQSRYGGGRGGRILTKRQRVALRRSAARGAVANRDKTLERSISRLKARVEVAKTANQD